MNRSANKSRQRRCVVALSLVVLLGCTSAGSFAEREVDMASSDAASELVAVGRLDLDLDALQAEWRALAFQIGRLKFATESSGERLDMNVVLAPVLGRLPVDVRNVWVRSLDSIVADSDGSSESRLQRELIATAIVLANDEALARAFGAQVGEAIEPSETSLTGFGDNDLLRVQGEIIGRISDGEADAERLAG